MSVWDEDGETDDLVGTASLSLYEVPFDNDGDGNFPTISRSLSIFSPKGEVVRGYNKVTTENDGAESKSLKPRILEIPTSANPAPQTPRQTPRQIPGLQIAKTPAHERNVTDPRQSSHLENSNNNKAKSWTCHCAGEPSKLHVKARFSSFLRPSDLMNGLVSQLRDTNPLPRIAASKAMSALAPPGTKVK